MTNYDKTEPSTIRALFDSIAPRYDLGNALLSGMLHKLWNRRLIQHALKARPKSVLDLCAGTGEIARGMYNKHPDASYCLVDFSEEMLQKAKDRLKSPNINFCRADAEELPLQDANFDAATCAYGIRNICNRQKALHELYRVLKPGASLSIIELTRPEKPLLRYLHKQYLIYMVPLIGKLITSNENAYKYLCNSINAFVAPNHLADELANAGFSEITMYPQTFGIATLITAKKP